MRRPVFAVLTLWLASCSESVTGPGLRAIDGARHAPLSIAGDDIHVLVFTSHECPIANAYAPTLAALHDAWRDQPRIRLYLLHVDPDLTADAALEHARAYDLPGTILLDPKHVAAAACGVTMTPEAVVLTAKGQLYRGRIDDQWRKLGSRAPAPSTRELGEAVGLALRGERFPEPHPPAVGCLLPDPNE